MKKEKAINEIMGSFLNHGISRRDFINALGALGISSAGISSLLNAAHAATKSSNPKGSYSFSGTGGELMVEQMKAAGVKYIFTNPGTFEVGFLTPCWTNPSRSSSACTRVLSYPLPMDMPGSQESQGSSMCMHLLRSGCRPALQRSLRSFAAGRPFRNARNKIGEWWFWKNRYGPIGAWRMFLRGSPRQRGCQHPRAICRHRSGMQSRLRLQPPMDPFIWQLRKLLRRKRMPQH